MLNGIPVLTGCDFVSGWERKTYTQDGMECINDVTSVRCRAYSDCAMSKMPNTAITLNVLPIIERPGEM